MSTTFFNLIIYSQIIDPTWQNLIPNYSFEKVSDSYYENKNYEECLHNFKSVTETLFNQKLVIEIMSNDTIRLPTIRNRFFSVSTYFGVPLSIGLGGAYNFQKGKTRFAISTYYTFRNQLAESYHGFELGVYGFFGKKWVFVSGISLLSTFNLKRSYHENTPNPNHHVLSSIEPNLHIGAGYVLKHWDFLVLPSFSYFRSHRFVYHYGEFGRETRNYFKLIPTLVITYKF
jgi:hypothetical protein